MWENFGQIARFVLITVAIIFAAWYTTWLIAAKSQGHGLRRGRMIRLLDSFSLARDKSVCLLEVCGKVYLVFVSGQGAILLDTPDPNVVAALAESGTLQGGFATLKEGLSWGRKSPAQSADQDQASPPRVSDPAPQPASSEESDELDEVYRRMLKRSAKLANRSSNQSPLPGAKGDVTR